MLCHMFIMLYMGKNTYPHASILSHIHNTKLLLKKTVEQLKNLLGLKSSSLYNFHKNNCKHHFSFLYYLY